jgi:hypothetical protein
MLGVFRQFPPRKNKHAQVLSAFSPFRSLESSTLSMPDRTLPVRPITYQLIDLSDIGRSIGYCGLIDQIVSMTSRSIALSTNRSVIGATTTNAASLPNRSTAMLKDE